MLPTTHRLKNIPTFPGGRFETGIVGGRVIPGVIPPVTLSAILEELSDKLDSSEMPRSIISPDIADTRMKTVSGQSYVNSNESWKH